MGAKAKIEISEEARDAELELVIAQPWFRAKIVEGEASPIVGLLTAARVHELVQAGIQRAKR
ncbi:MAG TPA: hypothetical protein VGU69_04035 [Rhizomicrobium sp.]|nr:hypothetical protein [Rhizomicrobium sp.]